MSEQPFKAITRLRKSGNLKEAWEVGVQAVKENPQDQYLKSAMFWVCYAYIKLAQHKIKMRTNSQNNEHTPNSGEIKEIEFYARCIEKLEVVPDDINYRSLLLSCQRNLEYFPNLILLLFKYSKKQMFGPAFGRLFLTEDKDPFDNGKGESPSLVLKFARKVAGAWLTSEKVRHITIEELCDLLSRTRAAVSDKQHLVWLDYDEAKCLLFANQFESAKLAARKIVRKKKSESWALSLLAQTYVQDDLDATTAIYSKALLCAKEETFALPVLKEFSPVLAEQKYFDEASMCLKRAVNCYMDNGWSIKADLEFLLNQPWYNPDVDINLLKPFIKKHAENAADYIAGARKQVLAIVLNNHESGKSFHAYFNKDKTVFISLSQFEAKTLPKIGEYISVTVSSEDDAVIQARRASVGKVEGVSQLKGALNVTPKGFGFVNDAFVPSHLIIHDMDGAQVKVVTVTSFDKKKNKYGMKAISINIMEASD